jgi:hypothetical protein
MFKTSTFNLFLTACSLMPAMAFAQSSLDELSPRLQAAHLVGTCGQFLDYGNHREEIRLTPLWNQYVRDINDIIGLWKDGLITADQVRVMRQADRDMLAKLVTGEIGFTEDVYLTCLTGLQDVIRNQYRPNFTWPSE